MEGSDVAGVDGCLQPIPSTNFKDCSWHLEESGQVIDPYARLKDLARALIGDQGSLESLVEGDAEIAEGGAATVAYGRLQFEDLPAHDREQIRRVLLRYCELDTLAMVMIVEAWRDWV